MDQATTLARNMTNALTTPWMRAMVTMSPLAMWATSWARTPSVSSSSILAKRPVETATRELPRLRPVAKALMAGDSKTPTSGMAGSPARREISCTLRTRRPCGPVGERSRTPMVVLAIQRLRQREMNAPAMPQTRQKTIRAPWSSPWAVM